MEADVRRLQLCFGLGQPRGVAHQPRLQDFELFDFPTLAVESLGELGIPGEAIREQFQGCPAVEVRWPCPGRERRRRWLLPRRGRIGDRAPWVRRQE